MHNSIAECAVVGMADDLRGQVPLALVVMKDQQTISDSELETELVALIREKIGAIAYLKHAIVVKRLPKTRSGKILRKTLRSMVDKTHYTIPSTIEDASVLTEVQVELDGYFEEVK
jgi:propionyl-CoA synthetase